MPKPPRMPPQRYEQVRLPWQSDPSDDRAARPRPARVLLLSPAYNAHIVAPHLGLGYLAAALKRSGHDAVVMDGLREPIRYEGEFDIVGVSAMTTYFPEPRAVRRRLRLLRRRGIGARGVDQRNSGGRDSRIDLA